MEIKNFQPADLDKMENIKSFFFADESKEAIFQRLIALDSFPQTHMATLVKNHRPIAILGLVNQWKGMGECLALTTDHVHEWPIQFHKAIKIIIEHYEHHLGLHRLQTTVREEYNNGMRWLESLGFKQEGLMVYYTSNKANHYMYARVRNL